MNFKRQVAYSRVSWDLDADNEIYVTGNWAQVKSRSRRTRARPSRAT
jgi:iron complex outermembrane receptor protein